MRLKTVSAAVNKTCDLDPAPIVYVAGEGNAGTFSPVHNAFVQQVADLRLFSCGIQAGSCPAAVKEAWT